MTETTPATAPPVTSEADCNCGDSLMASVVDDGLLNVALSGLATAAAAGTQRRTDAADQLASDSQRMWSIAMTTPTAMAGLGYRTATESGSGRTRAETNGPDNTSAPALAK